MTVLHLSFEDAVVDAVAYSLTELTVPPLTVEERGREMGKRIAAALEAVHVNKSMPDWREWSLAALMGLTPARAPLQAIQEALRKPASLTASGC